ncbi:MAG: hypothetical protein KF899_01785 [Parvibaculum sp.]|nr:hypothetical protein [Parvibaculum sp.]
MEARLRALFADASDRGPAALAHLQLLNLSEIRKEVGARWPKVQRLVHLLTETTLYRHLGPDDFFFVCREDVYVVAFPHLTPNEAAATCQRIVDEISHHLFGKDDDAEAFGEGGNPVGQLDVVATSFGVDRQQVHEASSALALVTGAALDRAGRNAVALSALDRKVEQSLAAAEAFLSVMSEEQPADRLPEVIRRLGSLIDQLRALERELMGPGAPSETKPDTEISCLPIEWDGLKHGYDFEMPQEWRAIPGSRQDALTRLSQTLTVAEERLAHFEALAARNATADDDICWMTVPDMPISYTIDYLPMLETRRSVVAIYLARIRFRLGDLPVTLDELLEIEDDLEVRAVASRLVARAVVKRAGAASCENSLRAVSVDDAIFRSAVHRRTFFEFISNIEHEVRRQLIVEVVLHAAWPPLQIEQSLLQLQPFCRAIFLRLPDLDIDVGNTAMFTPKIRKAVSAVGVAPAAGVNEENFLCALKKLVLQCEKLGLNTYLVETPSLAVFMNAIGMGVTFTSGVVILPACEEPSALHTKTIEDIFSARVPARDEPGRRARLV